MFPLSILQLQERMNNPIFANATVNNLTDIFRDEIDTRLKNQSNIIIDIWGTQGSGKSYTALSLCSFFPHFYTFWSKSDVINEVKNVKTPCVILLDEVTGEWGLGTYRIGIEYQSFLETLRKRQISFIHCSPTSKLLYLCHYGLEILYVDKENNQSVGMLYNREGTPLGIIRTPHPSSLLTPSVINEYESKKDQYLDTITHKNSTDNLSNLATEYLNSEQWRKDKLMWENKNRGKEIPNWYLEQSICSFFPNLKRNIETIELVNCVRYELLRRGE